MVRHRSEPLLLRRIIDMLNNQQTKKLSFICALKEMTAQEYIWSIVGEHLDNITVEDITEDMNKLFGNNEPTPTRNHSPNELFVIPPSSQKLYKKMELKRDKFYNPANGKCYIFDVYDMLLIQQHIKEGLTVSDVRELMKYFKTNNAQIYRVIYNIQENKQLNEYLDEFIAKMKKCTFTSSQGFILINGDTTGITLDELEELFYRLDNADNKQLCMHKLQKAHKDLADPLHIRLVCEHRNNPKLINLLREKEKKVEVVNNVEKRQNLLLNGGI